MNVRTALAAALAAGATLFAGACAGGPKHISEITPAVAERLSGAWVLNEAESDDPAQAVPAAGPGRGAVGPGGGRPPGGGMPPGGGIPPGGGMTGRPGAGGGGRPGMGGPGVGRPGGPGPGGSENRAAQQELRRMAMVAPRRVELSLSDSAVVVSYPREGSWLLLFGTDVKRAVSDSVEVTARSDWENGRLVVTRKVSGGGALTETFMPSADGSRLTVAVELATGAPRGGIEFHRVYERERSGLREPAR